ncbi:MAG: hypothetical protein ACOX2I_00595 [Candidatus Ozemobacteraceae bacterium]|jgi:hypothetical protein
MPVIHEKVGGALYIVSRLENQKHCTWQVSSEGELILRSFGLSEENTTISKFSLFLLKKNHLIFTNNTGFSDSLTSVKLTEIQKRELPHNERQFILAIRKQGIAARGPINQELSKQSHNSVFIDKIKPNLLVQKKVKKSAVKKALFPNFRFIDNITAECLKCHQKHTKTAIYKHLLTEHYEEPLLMPEILQKKHSTKKDEVNEDNHFITCPICGVSLKKLNKHMRKVHSAVSAEKEKNICQRQVTHQYMIDPQPGFCRIIDKKTGEVFGIYIGEKCKDEAIQRANELNKK